MRIGIAIVNYDSNGRLLEVQFTPSMQVTLSNAELARLAKIDGQTVETVESTATFALAAWFQRTNEIELADMNLNKIVTSAKDCKYWDNGKIRQCTVYFNFEKIQP